MCFKRGATSSIHDGNNEQYPFLLKDRSHCVFPSGDTSDRCLVASANLKLRSGEVTKCEFQLRLKEIKAPTKLGRAVSRILPTGDGCGTRLVKREDLVSSTASLI